MSTALHLTIATRESRLALWQAEHVRALLQAQGHQVTLLGMTTQGDQILDRALSKVGGKGLFVKELEVALEEGRADLAVHSLKDVPMELPSGFTLACVLEREDPRDAFVSPRYASLAELPEGAVVGTSSLRRQALLQALRPDLRVEPLRGNLDTRLRKLDEGGFDAIVLAAAGLMPEAMRRGSSSSTAPAWKTAFSMPFRLALSLARSIEAGGLAHETGWFFVTSCVITLVGGTMLYFKGLADGLADLLDEALAPVNRTKV